MNIFKDCGLENEVNALPKSLITQKMLSRSLVKLYEHGVEAAREALKYIVLTYDPLTKKRKTDDDVDSAGVSQKDIKKVVKALDCSQLQAVNWLREKEMDVDEVIDCFGRKIDRNGGFAEDLE